MRIFEAMNSARLLIRKRAGNRQAAFIEAEQLMTFCLNIPRETLFINFREQMPVMALSEYLAMARKRASGYPLQYITGTASFYGRDFFVSRGVLIPRQDTEALVEGVLKSFKPPAGFYKAADAGCGTGIIGMTLLMQGLNTAKFDLFDISAEAISCARQNMNRYSLKERITLKKGDFFALTARKSRYYDLIVSNPPYIKTGAKKALQKEVLKEPAKALFAGKDGLNFYKKLSKTAPRLLKSNGILAVEIGKSMEKAVSGLFKDRLEHIDSVRDTAGIIRALVFKKRSGGKNDA